MEYAFKSIALLKRYIKYKNSVEILRIHYKIKSGKLLINIVLLPKGQVSCSHFSQLQWFLIRVTQIENQ